MKNRRLSSHSLPDQSIIYRNRVLSIIISPFIAITLSSEQIHNQSIFVSLDTVTTDVLGIELLIKDSAQCEQNVQRAMTMNSENIESVTRTIDIWCEMILVDDGRVDEIENTL